MNNGFNALQRAVKKSFDQAATTANSGVQQNADVKFYENLTPDAFDVIAATYGPDNLVQYIQAMEAKRMKGASNG